MKQPAVVDQLQSIAHHDWKHSSRLDLTDQGLLAEMERHDIDAGDTLAISAPRKKKR